MFEALFYFCVRVLFIHQLESGRKKIKELNKTMWGVWQFI